MKRLSTLESIAKANGGTRASGTPGYKASVDYVTKTLRKAGYKPKVQAFSFPFYRQLAPSTLAQVSPTATTYVENTDYALMTYSASGEVSGTIQAVDLALDDLEGSTSGCEAADFTGFTAGNIALIRRGTCAFGEKVANAQKAGAKAVIVMNTGTPGNTELLQGTLGEPLATVPAIGTTFALGQALATGTPTVSIKTSTQSDIRTTWNVTAMTRKGTSSNVVMAGAHLDGVVEGAGINDNGSGSAALLEIAVKMAKTPVRNKVRFAWWGAEELGLLGSEHYVANLAKKSPASLKKIALYLNFDMIGSPNYGLFVYDGNNSRFTEDDGAATAPKGSAAIERTFHSYFASRGVASEETAFDGRSDYGPFIDQGIPAGGLFTGAEGVKTAAQAKKWGGTAGVAYDKCYHQACDNLGNVSRRAIGLNSDAMAHAILTYALSTKSVNGKSTRKGMEWEPAPGIGTSGSRTSGGYAGHGHHGVER
ncbi:M28 family peptidase [Nocardioides sp. zg-536]|uniref:M28 family peptidase n=2 Tax=Nocardioides faecalis TaxID=2803858 RepID=A0A938YBQ5_9ACTN|nr:M28 family peptidase [Nocardioides faecalis]MBS4754139.1 M28 family peptidase [Nocardioides faecalis]QVI60538.1 M28 family peptidase [Nocardioides faecalis]